MLQSNIRVKRSTSVLKELSQNQREKEKKPVRLNDRSLARLIPTRRENGNKSTFGKVLVVAGKEPPYLLQGLHLPPDAEWSWF